MKERRKKEIIKKKKEINEWRNFKEKIKKEKKSKKKFEKKNKKDTERRKNV